MNILIVSNLYPPHVVGGAEIVAHRHACELKKRGHRVTVFAGRLPQPGVEPGGLEIDSVDGIKVYRTVIRSLEPSDSFYRSEAANWLTSIVTTERIEIAQFHNLTGLGANLIPVARRLGVRTVMTLHDHWGFCLTNTRLRKDGALCRNSDECYQCVPYFTMSNGMNLPIRLRRDYVMWCLAQADQLVSPSRYLATAYTYAGFNSIDISVQSNGIDLERFACAKRTSSDKLRFTAIGYLGEHKGLPVLVEAVRRLSERRDLAGKWSMTFVGGGHLDHWLKSQLSTLEQRADVRFLGKLPLSKMPDLYADTEVVVLPSIWPENEPVVLLEAIAAGTAHLASKHGGNLELVDPDKSGFLFEPGNTGELFNAMVRYVEQPELAEQFGRYNRLRSKAFDEKTAVEYYEGLYAAPQLARRRDQRRAIVIVGGGWPTLQVTHLINTYSAMSKHNDQLLLIHSEFASPEVWSEAIGLWLWSTDCAESLMLRAMRWKLPLICPKGHDLAEGIQTIFGSAITYTSLVDVAATLNVLVEKRDRRQAIMTSANDAADLLTQVFDGTSYRMFCGRETR